MIVIISLKSNQYSLNKEMRHWVAYDEHSIGRFFISNFSATFNGLNWKHLNKRIIRAVETKKIIPFEIIKTIAQKIYKNKNSSFIVLFWLIISFLEKIN